MMLCIFLLITGIFLVGIIPVAVAFPLTPPSNSDSTPDLGSGSVHLTETIYTSGFDQISIVTNYHIISASYDISEADGQLPVNVEKIFYSSDNSATFYGNYFTYSESSRINITLNYDGSNGLEKKTFSFKPVTSEHNDAVNTVTFIPWESSSVFYPTDVVMRADNFYFSSDFSSILTENRPINAIYFYGDKQLQSYYWYKIPDIIFSKPLLTGEDVENYIPEFVINSERSYPEFLDLNCVFLCSNHDFEKDTGIPAFNSSCSFFNAINVSTDGVSQSNNDYFESVNARFTAARLPISQIQHYLINAPSPELELKFYPDDHSQYTVPFKFILGNDIPMQTQLVGNNYIISVPTPISSSYQAQLSSLSFPKELGDIFRGQQMMIDFESDEHEFLITGASHDGTTIVSCFDLSVGNEINSALREKNLKAGLIFKIPKVMDGELVNRDEITIFHKTESGMEKLELEIDSTSDADNFIVTAYTTSFSPFAAMLIEKPAASSFEPSGSVQYVENTSISGERPPQTITPLVNNPVRSTVETVLHKINGHFSLFSVLVVLISGMVMWNYLRKSL
ncbi:hypothetical protein [Methanolapillus ohkumae]